MTESGADALNIVIVGLGYVGVTAAACLASQGNTVVGVDVNEQKVSLVRGGHSPVMEPSVPEMIADAVAAGHLRASTELPNLEDIDLVIVCVGTPSAADGSHNMGYIAESARQIASAAARTQRKITVAFRSTFRPGTMDELIKPIFESAFDGPIDDAIELVYNPEFLRESTAVSDYFAPPKIVLGTSGGARSEIMHRLHRGIEANVFETGFREAEISKFVDNSWHAVKVAFANEVGRVCAAYGVDANVAHSIFVSDTKLNISPYYLRPGNAFGGSCLPKDVRAMQYIAASAGVTVDLVNSLIPSNEAHKSFQLDRVLARAEKGSRLLVAGLAFKVGTDDMRESPSVTLVADLIAQGYDVRVFDPGIHSSNLIGQNLGYVLTAIPRLRELLIDRDEVEASDFDLIISSNATGKLLADVDVEMLDLSTVAA
ncbi:MAG: nucleotide sugar dehydrogenase [Microbacterium gubbeenense]|uniref:nucleotide sugar dehydrogenase n=1 Tax=Microbacterium gubbeenense TaxID=159896 RepID=UPI003F9BFD7B